MTIDEAITRLEVFVKDASEAEPEILDNAIRLGIEALKRCQILAKNDTYWAARPLKGESK